MEVQTGTVRIEGELVEFQDYSFNDGGSELRLTWPDGSRLVVTFISGQNTGASGQGAARAFHEHFYKWAMAGKVNLETGEMVNEIDRTAE